jgi:hypothetical protein
MQVSIKIKNPVEVSETFGLPVEECKWWTGTPLGLYPSARPKPFTKQIAARVQYWSDGARVKGRVKHEVPEPPSWKARHCSGWAVRTLPRVLRGEITGKVCPIFAGPLGVLP